MLANSLFISLNDNKNLKLKHLCSTYLFYLWLPDDGALWYVSVLASLVNEI